MKKEIGRWLFKYLPTTKIPSIVRLSMDKVLIKQFKRLKPGVMLDVGAELVPYKKYIPYTKYLTLDVDEQWQPDIVSDLHQIDWEANYFDTIICTEVLEHLYDPQKAINEMHRILKPGGIIIASTRFIEPYHPYPNDYFRFSWDSLKYLFRQWSAVEIFHHGNRLHVIYNLINSGNIRMILNIFNPIIALYESKNTKCPNGFIIFARK